MERVNVHKLLFVLSLVGLLLSLYLLYLRFAPQQASEFCDINNLVSCSTVASSSYSVILGVPVSVIGAFGMLFLALISISSHKHKHIATFYSLLFALGFVAYLTFIEFFVINAVCIVCVAVALLVLVMFIIAAMAFGRESLNFARSIKFE